MKKPSKLHLHQLVLIGIALIFLAVFLVLPLLTIFMEAFAKGVRVYTDSLTDPLTLSAARLTLISAAVAVALNLCFGISAAWVITKFNFRGKGLLVSLLDVPLAVSPVIAGMALVLIYGNRGLLADVVNALGLKIIFAPPGIALATTFVTAPFIARELIPLMLAQGTDEEEAALTMGASGFKTFVYVTLPNIRWALLYGVILCNARAMGEFGAVSVVSGHIRGLTNTLPLHIEILYNEYQFAAGFAAASLLTALALLTLFAKEILAATDNRSPR